MTKEQLLFSVSREDLAFNFAHTLEDIFCFASFSTDQPTPADGVRQSETLGYDFQNECTPVIKLLPLSEQLAKETGVSLDDLQVNVFIEDTGLAIREQIFSIPANEIVRDQKREIDLKSFAKMSFSRGFEVKCFISRNSSAQNANELIWHKSQIIFQKSFIVKAALDEALFEITWVNFTNEEDKKNLLYFIDWSSSEVSTAIDTDCFQVKANSQLKDQFKRLENNSHFGGFCIRMIAEQILGELLQQTLRLAKIDVGIEPQTDSLHDKFKLLLQALDFDFEDLAKMFQSSNKMDQLNGAAEVRKIFQRMNNVGSALETIRFGGYR